MNEKRKAGWEKRKNRKKYTKNSWVWKSLPREMLHLKVDSLPDPSNRFDLGEEIATGVWAKVS